LAGGHANQNHADDSIQPESPNAQPGNGMPGAKHEKESNLRVVLQ
jgi:hypothetical protein